MVVVLGGGVGVGGWGVTQSACVSPADGPLCGESWGVGAQSFPCARAGPALYPTLHLCVSAQPFSPPPLPPLLCLLLFCLSVRVSLLLTFSHTKVIHCRFHSGTFFFKKKGGAVFLFLLPMGCFVFFFLFSFFF